MGDRIKWKLGHWEKSRYISVSKRGHWSKYGDGTAWKEPEEQEWNCQSCGTKQFAFMPSGKMTLDTGEQLRVCALCKHVSRLRDILDIGELIELVRPREGYHHPLANLLSLPIL